MKPFFTPWTHVCPTTIRRWMRTSTRINRDEECWSEGYEFHGVLNSNHSVMETTADGEKIYRQHLRISLREVA